MKISIIVPVYNGENHIKNCVQSILKQSYTDFELLLIDDGSTDTSGALCDDFATKDKRIRVFHQENGGPSSARNKGISEMQGDFVTFIDADDYVDKGYLEAFIPSDMDIKNSIVLQGYTWENNEGEVKTHQFKRKRFPKSAYSDLFYTNNLIQRHPFACIKLFPVHLIKTKNIYFDEDIKFGEDLLFFLACLKYTESVLLVEQTGYHYQYNTTSLTRTIYNYESEIKRSNNARNQLAEIAELFSFDERTISFHKTYMKQYFYRAIYSLYLHYPRKKRRERVALLKENGRGDNFELMTKYNNPNTGFTKGFKFLFSNKLFNLLDLYIVLWFKFRKTGLESLSNRTEVKNKY